MPDYLSQLFHSQRSFVPRFGNMLIAVALLALAGVVSANLLGGKEPLPAELAFVPEIRSVDAVSNEGLIEVSFAIEDGYYLYRDKLAFAVEDITLREPSHQSGSLSLFDTQPISRSSEPANTVLLSSPDYPEALELDDDFFGLQAIFREQVVFPVPFSAGHDVKGFILDIKYQGCADIGLCYPPTHVKLPVTLPDAEQAEAGQADPQVARFELLPTSPAGNASSPVGNFSQTQDNGIAELLLPDDDQELLPPELAYLPQIVSANKNEIRVQWAIEDGYYLYRDKTSFSLNNGLAVDQGNTYISEGVEQYDEFFGNVRVLRRSADALLAISAPAGDSLSSSAELTINYQGCADIGVCFPPSTVTLPVIFDRTVEVAALASVSDGNLTPLIGKAASSGSTTTTVSTSTTTTGTLSQAPAQSEQDRLMGLLGSNSLWLNIITFFGLGLLLAFTPCVLPMIPILSSMIVGQGQSMSTGRAFQLSLVYVLVMATTYAAVGVAVGLSGYNVQAFLQNPWVLSGIAALFVVLSLSMFGFYQLQMPAAFQARLTQWSSKQSGGQFGSVAAMGFISSLIVGPCVTAPLAGALIYIAKTGDAIIGGAALFALGLGMGAPLLLIGTSAGKLIPRAGAWMNVTQKVFGVLLLAMAIYMLSRFLPAQITMALAGILALMSGVYLGATDSTTRDSSGWQRFGKGIGLVASVYGVALMIGAFAGGSSYTTPLRAITGSGSTQTADSGTHALPFQPVKSLADLQNAVNQASAQGRPLMLDFYADWCISCKEMEAFTFTDKRVQTLLANAIVVQADVTANDALDQALLKEFDLFGPPGIIFYSADGQELPAARVVGFLNADKFSEHIESFLGNPDTTLSMR